MTIPVLVGAIAALFTTLFGALVGPVIIERRRYLRSETLRTRGAREHPYTDFVNAVERVQLSLDLRATGRDIDPQEYLIEFRQMEEARAGIDLVGTMSARVWAYRCRLTISAMHRTLEEDGTDGVVFRAKLHEARSRFVVQARAELAFVVAPQPPTIDASEDTASGHKQWLQAEVTSNAREAVLVSFAELAPWGAFADRESESLNEG